MLERTEEHSSSLSLTKHMDNEWKAGLGTLGRFPLEVRRRIYNFLMVEHCRKHIHQTFHELRFKWDGILLIDEHTRYDRYEAGIFDFRLHNGDCGNQCCTSGSLRLQHTSSTLRNEYRDNLLASTRFNFIRPAGAVGFLTSLNPHDKLQIRRLILNIAEGRDLTSPRGNNAYDKYLQWKWICSAIPPTITLVVLDTMCNTSRWMTFDHPGLGYEARPLMGVFMELQCALLTTEVICKEVKTRAPKAKFQLGLCHINYEACFHAVMEEYN